MINGEVDLNMAKFLYVTKVAWAKLGFVNKTAIVITTVIIISNKSFFTDFIREYEIGHLSGMNYGLKFHQKGSSLGFGRYYTCLLKFLKSYVRLSCVKNRAN